MLQYLSLDIICSFKLSEQIMSADKYLRIFLSQMEAIVYFIQCRTFHIREGVIFFFGFFIFILVFYILGVFLRKKLFHLCLLDMRWLQPSQSYGPCWLFIISSNVSLWNDCWFMTIHQIFSFAHDLSKLITLLNMPQLKLGTVWVTLPICVYLMQKMFEG